MGSIPLPALGIQPPAQQPNPMEQYARVMQLKGMMQAQAVGNIQLQQQQQQLKDQQAMTKAMGEWDGQSYDTLRPLIAQYGGSANAQFAIQQHALDIQSKYSEMRKNDAQTGQTTADTLLKNSDAIAGKMKNLLALPDEELHGGFQQAIQDLSTPAGPGQKPMLGPQQLTQAQQMMLLDPATLRTRLDWFRKSFMANSAQLNEAKDAADTAEKQQATLSSKAQLPGQLAESQQKQMALTASRLAASTSQADYEGKLAKIDPQTAAIFPKQFDRMAVLKAGMTPTEQAHLPTEMLAFNDWSAKPENKGKTLSDYVIAMKKIVPAFDFSLQANGLQGGGAPIGANGKPLEGGDFLKSLAPSEAGMVKALDEGRMEMPTGYALSTPRMQKIIADLNTYDPNFSAQSFELRKGYTVGAQSKEINAINTAMGHVGVLGDAVTALENNDVKVMNQMANALGAEVGATPKTTFETIVHRVGPELSKAYVGAGGSANERGGDEKDFDPALGPEQLRSNVAITAKLLRSKIGALENQWNQTLPPGGQDFRSRFITPEAQSALDKWAPAGTAAKPAGKGMAGWGKAFNWDNYPKTNQ